TRPTSQKPHALEHRMRVGSRPSTLGKPLPLVGRKADMKPSEYLVAESSVAKIAPRGRCLGGFDEHLTKQIAGPLHGGVESSLVARGSRRQRLMVDGGERDPRLLGQEFERLAELESLEPHDKVEDISP